MDILDISEQFLRRIWEDQLFCSENLHTTDGRPVRIVSPGNANDDAGPDFHDATIRVGTTTFCGDVELHKDPTEWISHGHHTDPHYNRVILHVVLTATRIAPPAITASKRLLPLLVLHPYLDATLRNAWHFSDEHKDVDRKLRCSEVNGELTPEWLGSYLDRLGRDRIELKIRRFGERLKELVDEQMFMISEPYPRYYATPDEIPVPRRDYTRSDFTSKNLWEQLLYEGIMESLGYSRNSTSFAALARVVRLQTLREFHSDDVISRMALLFGAAGLIPRSDKIKGKEERRYATALKKIWKEHRPRIRGGALNEGDWLFFRLRPSNFPTARIAAMAFLAPTFFSDTGFRQLILTLKDSELDGRERLGYLRSIFAFEPDRFWKSHYHLERPSSQSRITLGQSRIGEIIVNVIIPITLLYARIFRDRGVRESAIELLSIIPAGPSHRISQHVEKYLLRNKSPLRSAIRSQGVLQLYKRYCLADRCTECHVGRSVF